MAHPGRTASDGCHYCRTNCDSWGVPWDELHCHRGSSDTTASQQSSTNVTATNSPVYPTKVKKIIKPTNKPITSAEGIVTRIIDGDTIYVKINGKSEKVRLLAIDTPESVDPRKPVQCFSKEATKYLSSLIKGKTIKLIPDKTQSDRDKYGRLLRFVTFMGKDINAEMVRQGYAFSYKEYPSSRLNEYNKLEKQAKNNDKGLWGNCAIKK